MAALPSQINSLRAGHYRTQPQNDDGSFSESNSGFGIHVEVKDPYGDIVMSKDYAGALPQHATWKFKSWSASGRFVFNTHASGEHSICLHTDSKRWFGGKTIVCHAACLCND